MRSSDTQIAIVQPFENMFLPTSNDIDSALRQALAAAKEKQRCCIEKRWTPGLARNGRALDSNRFVGAVGGAGGAGEGTGSKAAKEGDGELEGENFWPGFGRWRLAVKLEDTELQFPLGKYWE
jgi:hypothetical protein